MVGLRHLFFLLNWLHFFQLVGLLSRLDHRVLDRCSNPFSESSPILHDLLLLCLLCLSLFVLALQHRVCIFRIGCKLGYRDLTELKFTFLIFVCWFAPFTPSNHTFGVVAVVEAGSITLILGTHLDPVLGLVAL